MRDIINGDNLDEILKYSLSKNNGSIIFVNNIVGKILLDFNQDQIILMIKYIESYGNNVLEIDLIHNPNFIATGITESFLKSGGFTKIFNEKETELNSIKESKEKDKKIKEFQLEELEYKKTIRNQEQRIRDLEEELNFWNLMKVYKYFILSAITLGGVLGAILF